MILLIMYLVRIMYFIVHIDFQKAFKNITYQRLQRKLSNHGTRKKFLAQRKKDKKFIIEINKNLFYFVKVTSGIP